MAVDAVRTSLRVGDQVADVVLVEALGSAGGVVGFRAERADGSGAVVYATAPGTPPDLVERFLGAAADIAEGAAVEGMLPIVAIDPTARAYVGDMVPAGTMADLPMMQLGLEATLTMLRSVCTIVARLHAEGGFHGCLRPEHVLLDDDLRPIVANAQAVDVAEDCRRGPQGVARHRAFTAPEIRFGRDTDERADVYSLGRMLHFALAGAQHDPVDEQVPRLDELVGHPEPLIDIVRRSTLMNPAERYQNAAQLQEDLERYERGAAVGMQRMQSTRPPDSLGAPVSTRAPAPDARVSRPRVSAPGPALRTSSTPAAAAPPAKGPAAGGPAKAKLTPALIAVLVGVALALLGASVVVGHVSRSSGLVTTALGGLGAIALGLAVPAVGPSKRLVRLLYVLVALGVVVAVNPAGLAADRAKARLEPAAGSPAERQAAFLALVRSGEKVLFKADLEGTDLTGQKLERLVLDGSTLRNANCRGASFRDSSLINVDLTEADLSGANLAGATAEFARGFERARCDDQTTMPTGYVCSKGQPLVSEAPAPKPAKR
jgi:hypothetical protein